MRAIHDGDVGTKIIMEPGSKRLMSCERELPGTLREMYLTQSYSASCEPRRIQAT